MNDKEEYQIKVVEHVFGIISYLRKRARRLGIYDIQTEQNLQRAAKLMMNGSIHCYMYT